MLGDLVEAVVVGTMLLVRSDVVEDVVEDKTTGKDSRRIKIESQIKNFSIDAIDYTDPNDSTKTIITKPLEKLLEEEKKKLIDPTNSNFVDEKLVKKNDNDINQILKVMKNHISRMKMMQKKH